MEPAQRKPKKKINRLFVNRSTKSRAPRWSLNQEKRRNTRQNQSVNNEAAFMITK